MKYPTTPSGEAPKYFDFICLTQAGGKTTFIVANFLIRGIFLSPSGSHPATDIESVPDF